MRDIAFMGHARSGKDTAGRYLVENHGFRRVSFADPVRESLLALDPIVEADVERYGDGHRDVRAETVRLSEVVGSFGWERAKDGYPEVRALLQRMGTDAVRGVVGDDTWIRVARDKVDAANLEGVPVVVTDVRFPNEAAFLRAEGFHLVWLTRPGFEPVNRHASENSVSFEDADSVLPNSGTLDELYALLDTLVG